VGHILFNVHYNKVSVTIVIRSVIMDGTFKNSSTSFH